MKVLLDTNVLVSAYATRGLCSEVFRLVLAEHEMVVAEVVLGELERVLLQKIRLPPPEVTGVFDFLRELPVQPRPESPGVIEVSDPDDAWVLASAVEAGVDVLVTGDPDLLEIATAVEGIEITDPRGFWELCRRRRT